MRHRCLAIVHLEWISNTPFPNVLDPLGYQGIWGPLWGPLDSLEKKIQKKNLKKILLQFKSKAQGKQAINLSNPTLPHPKRKMEKR